MISKFTGEYSFLSNFYHSPFCYQGNIYPTAEHAFQAYKTLDGTQRIIFHSADLTNDRTELSPGQAKQLGRKLDLREDWEEVKVDVMRDVLRAKFEFYPCREMLLETGDQELVEGNHWNDTFWGVCRSKGKNTLGKLLMEVREELRG